MRSGSDGGVVRRGRGVGGGRENGGMNATDPARRLGAAPPATVWALEWAGPAGATLPATMTAYRTEAGVRAAIAAAAAALGVEPVEDERPGPMRMVMVGELAKIPLDETHLARNEKPASAEAGFLPVTVEVVHRPGEVRTILSRIVRLSRVSARSSRSGPDFHRETGTCRSSNRPVNHAWNSSRVIRPRCRRCCHPRNPPVAGTMRPRPLLW
jgi:hypothetical protein